MTTFESIYKDNYKAIFNFIKGRVGFNTEVAEELTNDVFIKVNEHLKVFNPELSKVSTWIHTIAKNIIIDHYRKNKNSHLTQSTDLINSEGNEVFVIPSNANTSDLIEGKELSSAIHNAMEKLSQKQREVAELFFLHNKKYVEICEILDIPMERVKVTLLRAKIKLQESLKEVYEYSY